jgi:hypothetical protein
VLVFPLYWPEAAAADLEQDLVVAYNLPTAVQAVVALDDRLLRQTAMQLLLAVQDME